MTLVLKILNAGSCTDEINMAMHIFTMWLKISKNGHSPPLPLPLHNKSFPNWCMIPTGKGYLLEILGRIAIWQVWHINVHPIL